MGGSGKVDYAAAFTEQLRLTVLKKSKKVTMAAKFVSPFVSGKFCSLLNGVSMTSVYS